MTFPQIPQENLQEISKKFSGNILVTKTTATDVAQISDLKKDIKDIKDKKNNVNIENLKLCLSTSLKCMCEKNFVHNDIKPENVFRHAEHYMLGDFGLMRSIDSEDLVGSAFYMGPCFNRNTFALMNMPDSLFEKRQTDTIATEYPHHTIYVIKDNLKRQKFAIGLTLMTAGCTDDTMFRYFRESLGLETGTDTTTLADKLRNLFSMCRNVDGGGGITRKHRHTIRAPRKNQRC